MLYWTCPECGRECSPAVRECPACPPRSEPKPSADPANGRSQEDDGIVALARNLETIHAVPLLSPSVAESIGATENGHHRVSATAALLEESPIHTAPPAEEALVVLAEETPAMPLKETVDSMVQPLVESVERTETDTFELVPNLGLVQPSIVLDAPAAAGEEALQETAESTNQLPLELGPAPEPPAISDNASPAADSLDTSNAEALEALVTALRAQAEAVVDVISAELDAEREAIRNAEREAVCNIVASFEKRCPTSLLAAPAEIVTAPAPPTFEWIRTRRPFLQPIPPPAENPAGTPAYPQAATVAGPCLCPELRNLTELEPPKTSRKSGALPGWFASLLGATLVVLLAVTSFQYFSGPSDAKSPKASASQSAAMANAGEAFERSVEISGLRLATNWRGKEQVRFLIVNHSNQELSHVTVQITVRSSDAGPGSAPLLLIHAPLRSLGAYQSKEIRTDLDSDIPASAMADWQSLHADVQVAAGE